MEGPSTYWQRAQDAALLDSELPIFALYQRLEGKRQAAAIPPRRGDYLYEYDRIIRPYETPEAIRNGIADGCESGLTTNEDYDDWGDERKKIAPPSPQDILVISRDGQSEAFLFGAPGMPLEPAPTFRVAEPDEMFRMALCLHHALPVIVLGTMGSEPSKALRIWEYREALDNKEKTQELMLEIISYFSDPEYGKGCIRAAERLHALFPFTSLPQRRMNDLWRRCVANGTQRTKPPVKADRLER